MIMDRELLIGFVVLNILNITVSTIKSIVTIKCGKEVAAIINAISYGINTVATVYLMCDLPIYLKALIVSCCNLVAVYIVKFGEERMRKDKLWKIEITLPRDEFKRMKQECKDKQLTYNYIDIGKYYLFNFYCPTAEDSNKIKELLGNYHAKFFVNESKTL